EHRQDRGAPVDRDQKAAMAEGEPERGDYLRDDHSLCRAQKGYKNHRQHTDDKGPAASVHPFTPSSPHVDVPSTGALSSYHDPGVEHFGALAVIVHLHGVEVHLADRGHLFDEAAHSQEHVRQGVLVAHGEIAITVEELKPAYSLDHAPSVPVGEG